MSNQTWENVFCLGEKVKRKQNLVIVHSGRSQRNQFFFDGILQVSTLLKKYWGVDFKLNKLKMKTLKLFFMLFALGLFFSCTNQSQDIFENYSIEYQEYLNSKSYKLLSLTFPIFTKGLDSKNIIEYSEKEIFLYSIKSKINEQALGVLYFSKNLKGEYKTIVELYSYDINDNLIEVNFKNILGQEILSAGLTKISGQLYSFNIKNNLNLNSEKRGWWACTRGCVADAWGICSNDPECDFVCGLAGGYLGCAAYIASACSAWCASDSDNDLSPENGPIPH